MRAGCHDGARVQAGGVRRGRASARRLAEHRARARGPRAACPPGARAARRGRRPCRCPAAASGALHAAGDAGGERQARWRSQLSGAEARARSRRAAPAAGRWCRCRGGRARSPRAAARRAAGRARVPPSSASSSPGSSAGQSPGTHSTRCIPSANARRTPSAAAARLAALGGVLDDDRPVFARASAAIASSHVTTIVRSIDAVWASASITSATIACASPGAAHRRRSHRGAAWPARSALRAGSRRCAC